METGARTLTGYSPAILDILQQSRGARSSRVAAAAAADAETLTGVPMTDRVPQGGQGSVSRSGSAGSAASSASSSQSSSAEREDRKPESSTQAIQDVRFHIQAGINEKIELEQQIQAQNEELRRLGEERAVMVEHYEHEKAVYEHERGLIEQHMAVSQDEIEEIRKRTKQMEVISRQYEENVRNLDAELREAKASKKHLEKRLQERELSLGLAEQKRSLVEDNKRHCTDTLQVTENLLLGLKEDINNFRAETEKRMQEMKQQKDTSKNQLSEMNNGQILRAREYQMKLLNFENELRNLMEEKKELDTEIIRLEEKISKADITQQETEIRIANKDMNRKLIRKNVINRNIELVNELNAHKYELEALEAALASKEEAATNARRTSFINRRIQDEELNIQIKDQDKKRKDNEALIGILNDTLKRLQTEQHLMELKQLEEGSVPQSNLSDANLDTDGEVKQTNPITRLNDQIDKETDEVAGIKKNMEEDKIAFQQAKDEFLEKINQSKEKLQNSEKIIAENTLDNADIENLKGEIERLSGLNSAITADIAKLESKADKIISDHATSRDMVERNNENILANEQKKILELRDDIDKLRKEQEEEMQVQEELNGELANVEQDLAAAVADKQKSLDLKQEIELIANQMETERNNELEERNKELKANTQKLGTLKQTKEDLKGRKKAVEDESAEMDKQIATMRLELDDLKIKKDTWTKDLEAMRSHFESTRKLHELRAEQASKSIAQLKAQKQLEITILKNDAVTLDNNLREIKMQAENVNMEIHNKEQQRDALKEKNRLRSEKYKEMEAKSLANLEQNKKKLEDIKERFNGIMKAHEDDINNLKQQIDAVRKENKEKTDLYNNELVHTNDETRADMEKQIIALTHEIEELDKKVISNRESFFMEINNLKNFIENNEQLIAKGENEKKHLEEELAKAQSTSESVSATNVDKLEQEKQELEKMEHKVDDLTSVRDILNKDIDNKTKQIEDIKKALVDYENSIADTNNELESAKKDYIHASEEKDKVILDYRMRTTQANNKRADIEREQSELLREEEKIDALLEETRRSVEDSTQAYSQMPVYSEGAQNDQGSSLYFNPQLQQQHQQNSQTGAALTMSSIGIPMSTTSHDVYDQESPRPQKEQIPRIQQEIQNVEERIESVKSEFNDTYEQIEKDIIAMEEQIETNNNIRDIKMDGIKESETEVRFLNKKIEDEKEKIEKTNGEIKNVSDNIIATNDKSDAKEQDIEKVNENIAELDRLTRVIENMLNSVDGTNNDVIAELESEANNNNAMESAINNDLTINNILDADKEKLNCLKDEFEKTEDIIGVHVGSILDKLDVINRLQGNCDALLSKMQALINNISTFGKNSMSETTQEIIQTFGDNLVSLFNTVYSQLLERKQLIDELSKCINRCQFNLTNVVSFCGATRDDIMRAATRRLNALASERDEALDYVNAAGKSSGLLTAFIEMSTNQNENLETLLKCVEDVLNPQNVENINPDSQELEKVIADVNRLSKIVPQKRNAPFLRVGAE